MADLTNEQLQSKLLQQQLLARENRQRDLNTQAREGFQSGVAGVVGLPNTIIGATREALAAPTTGRRGAGAGQPQNVPQTPTQPGLLERHTISPQEAYAGMSQVTHQGITPPQTTMQRMVRATTTGLGAGVVGGPQGMAGGALSGFASQGSAELGAPPIVQEAAGALAPLVAGMAIRPKNIAPSLENLTEMKNAAYKAAEDAGVRLTQQKTLKIAADVTQSVLHAGVNDTIHPGAVAALKQFIQDAKSAPFRTLQQMEITRRIFSGVAKSNVPDERRLGKLMLKRLDEHIDNLSPSDVTNGNAPAAVSALKQGRQLWSQFQKATLIENTIDKAKRMAAKSPAGNFESSLRTGINNILNTPSKLRGFTGVERDLMRKMVDTGAFHDFLQWVGNFSPEGNSLKGYLGLAAGVYNPLALAIPAAGAVARRTSAAISKSQANTLSETIRSGGILPGLSPKQNSQLNRLLSGGMTAGAVRQGNQ